MLKKQKLIFFLQLINNQSDLWVDAWNCRKELIPFVNCPHSTHFWPPYFWTRFPLPTTRMWNLLSIFDPPAYACFFSSLILTVVFMKVFAVLGTKMGLDSESEELILIPTRLKFYNKNTTQCKSTNLKKKN